MLQLANDVKKRESCLINILSNHGELIHDLILNWHEYPEIEMPDIAEIANVSRQRVHQWLVVVHGNSKKRKLSSVSSYKNCRGHIYNNILRHLMHNDYKFIKMHNVFFDNEMAYNIYKFVKTEHLFALRRFHGYYPSNAKKMWLRCKVSKDINYLFGFYNDELYILPDPHRSTCGYIQIGLPDIQLYKNNYDILSEER